MTCNSIARQHIDLKNPLELPQIASHNEAVDPQLTLFLQSAVIGLSIAARNGVRAGAWDAGVKRELAEIRDEERRAEEAAAVKAAMLRRAAECDSTRLH